MGMSDLYGPADRSESIATIHGALNAGITLLDTGDFYASGHNEMLIRDALQGHGRDQVVISVKFGAMRDPPEAGSVSTAPRRSRTPSQSLRLGTDYIDIYRPARRIPGTDRGHDRRHVRHGQGRYVRTSACQVSAQTVLKAHAASIDLQIGYSRSRAGSRRSPADAAQLGVGVTPMVSSLAA
jgi:aryl-alcohol dehydrogenase-like predicted oxidoreductase